ncbi:MAG: livM1 [Defluviitaleaceae bacterium]|uniref:Branched-chain amino acid ABC transporter permease n=1 Tax=Defluviitalea raffinosedens TaxID=1450156 RepID=A0A7C8LF76_9FIRM|nr:branched-chain amino acid ABC transporter permease [Defluviitalea raffinosedens]KAE9637357.1 branched-chain amino acid ABC transporter permease [Defluviitalea raffinosedens]MBZ4668298.1 livM1 [Defluviitaleaceae bacterium]HHW66878.1 branched-chain amino acid ABC transporter permease [Candidatus Epulonipiscium sp.]
MKNRLKSYFINIGAIIVIYALLTLLMKTGIINSYYEVIVISIGINIILAVSLNLATGYLGQLALGHAGFMAVGAYVSAICTAHMNLPDTLQLIVSLLIGGIVAGIFGILVGVPALRLKGDYLAIITLAFGEIIRVIILNLKITGGARGLKGIPLLTSFNSVYWITVIIVAIIYTLINSRHGRAIISIREDEIAAESVGIPTTFYKNFAFSLAALFAGIGGGLYAHYYTVLDPGSFDFMRSIEILIIVVLGGMGSLTGSIVAAIVLTILPQLLIDFADWRMLIYSIILVIMMIFRPEGLFGKKEFSLMGLLNIKQKAINTTPNSHGRSE